MMTINKWIVVSPAWHTFPLFYVVDSTKYIGYGNQPFTSQRAAQREADKRNSETTNAREKSKRRRARPPDQPQESRQ